MNCREQILLCVVGIVGNRLCCVLWELWGRDTVVCCGNCREQIVLRCCANCREQIVLCVVGIVGNK